MPNSAVDWLVGPASAIPLQMPAWSGPIPLGAFGDSSGALPLGPEARGGGSALPLGGEATLRSIDPFPMKFNTPAMLKREREAAADKAEKGASGRQAQAVGQRGNAAAARAQGYTTAAPGGDAAAQIMALAQQRFGPEGAKVVGALLQAEGGLGGAVGDTNISAVGSHGPFQFYGPGGQLDAYARALGTDLATAGAQARANPVAAAEWALDNYLGQAIGAGVQQGLTGEALLRRALSVQNPGALNSPTHYGRYRDALSSGAYLDRTPAPAYPGTNPANILPALRSPFDGADYRIAFDVNQRYSTPLPGGTTHHRGVDIVPTSGGLGAPVTALAGGTVVDFRQGGAQGNAVVLDAGDGTYHAYFHLLDPNTLRPGAVVQPGQQIGRMGQSGSEGFPHLHLEVRRNINGDPRGSVIDPLAYFGLR